MKRVVYTAVFGNRESLRELPFVPSGAIEYVAFCDWEPLPTSETWKVLQADPYWNGDDVRNSRRIKLLGAEALESFDQWLWVDNRIQLLREPSAIFDLLDDGPDLRMALHDHRLTVADEFKAVLRDHRDSRFHVKELLNLMKIHYPFVLREKPWSGGMILRRNSQDVKHFMAVWFSLVLRFSRRDQLSVNLAGYLAKFRPVPLGFGLSASRHHVWLRGRDVMRSKNSGNDYFRLSFGDVLLELLTASAPAYWSRIIFRGTGARLRLAFHSPAGEEEK